MAKIPSLKQQLLAWADHSTFAPTKHSLMTDIVRDQLQATGRWIRQLGTNSVSSQGVVVVGAIALLVWNWQLLIATSIGVSITVLVYRGAHAPLRLTGAKLMRSLFDSPLLLALITGLLSLVISYSTLLIWQDTGQLGLALAALLQGACMLSVLGLFIGQLKPSPPTGGEDPYEQWVTQLMATDALPRLIAVRRLSQIELLTADRRQELSEYFQLLLAQELHPQIRDAVLLGLKRFDAQADRSKSPHQSKKNVPPRPSLEMKRRVKVRKERVYAELEAHPEESWVQ